MTRHVRLVQYNDLEAVERELARGDVACVLAEAAVTNTGVILPAEGFHAGLRRLPAERGAVDHRRDPHAGRRTGWSDRPLGARARHLVMGKSIASGVPLGAYGMTAEVARCSSTVGVCREEVATGGTLFANALSMAAARVTLADVLTDEAYEHASALGARLADGIEAVGCAHDLGWRAHRLFNRSGYTHAPELPLNAPRLARPSTSTCSICSASSWPTAASGRRSTRPVPRAAPDQRADVDRYLEVLDDFLDEVAGG